MLRGTPDAGPGTDCLLEHNVTKNAASNDTQTEIVFSRTQRRTHYLSFTIVDPRKAKDRRNPKTDLTFIQGYSTGRSRGTYVVDGQVRNTYDDRPGYPIDDPNIAG